MGDSWEALIIVNSSEYRRGGTMPETWYYGDLSAIYTADDINYGREVQIDESHFNFTGEDSVGTTFINNASSLMDTLKEFAANMAKNWIGTLISLLLEGLTWIADVFQILINMLQTVPLGTVTDFTLEYGYSQLEADGAISGNRDMYTNVSSYNGENYVSYEGQKCVYVDGVDKEFTENTKIPIIPVEIYNLAIGDVGAVDVNFLQVDSSHSDNSVWMFLRNFAVGIMRITLYIAAALLITTLIWHGIHIVSKTLDNPINRAEHKEGLKRFCTSVLMLVGTIVIMALCIFASYMFLGDIKSSTSELPIRVNVSLESGGYSFSTNITGYLRYMAQIKDVNKFGEKAVYTFEYILLVLINIFCSLVMLVRMALMLILGILGPIVAAKHALNVETDIIMDFSTWVNYYIILAMLQVILALACKIAIESLRF